MTRRAYDRRVAALTARYAYLFAGPPVGHSIAPGWLGIVERLCAGVDGVLAEAERRAVYFLRITERFGGLRVDLSVSPLRLDMTAPDGRDLSCYFGPLRKPRPEDVVFRRIEPLVSAAEAKSRVTCGVCGAPGELRRAGDRARTLCERHARSRPAISKARPTC
jgi:hypothetical protein